MMESSTARFVFGIGVHFRHLLIASKIYTTTVTSPLLQAQRQLLLLTQNRASPLDIGLASKCRSCAGVRQDLQGCPVSFSVVCSGISTDKQRIQSSTAVGTILSHRSPIEAIFSRLNVHKFTKNNDPKTEKRTLRNSANFGLK